MSSGKFSMLFVLIRKSLFKILSSDISIKDKFEKHRKLCQAKFTPFSPVDT